VDASERGLNYFERALIGKPASTFPGRALTAPPLQKNIKRAAAAVTKVSFAHRENQGPQSGTAEPMRGFGANTSAWHIVVERILVRAASLSRDNDDAAII